MESLLLLAGAGKGIIDEEGRGGFTCCRSAGWCSNRRGKCLDGSDHIAGLPSLHLQKQLNRDPYDKERDKEERCGSRVDMNGFSGKSSSGKRR
jgi:hypothetical protein